jgi:hypothetical protein
MARNSKKSLEIDFEPLEMHFGPPEIQKKTAEIGNKA